MRLPIYPDERRPVALAAAAACVLEASEGLVANCADTLYLARRGAAGLGVQLALSSALLVVTLAAVGALADRWPRARLLNRLALGGAVLLVALRGALALAPSVAPAILVIAGKQLASAIDLAFWVLMLDCFDPRQARRVVPVLMAAGGAGLVLGSLLTRPLVLLFSVDELLTCAAAACLGGAAIVAALGRVTRPGAVLPTESTIAVLRDGARATLRVELARRLFVIVAIAGAFGPILYTALGAAAAQAYPSEGDLASFYGRYRAAINLAALIAQLVVAPAVVGLVGVGSSFLVAPLVGLLAGWGLFARSNLTAAAVAQAAARVADAAFQTAAEKLAHNLLPRASRGRMTAFLDGIAKRGGALLGGLAVAAVAAKLPAAGALAAALAGIWLLSAALLRRRYPALAVAALAARRVTDPDIAPVDEATLRHLRKDLAGRDDARRELALEAIMRGPEIKGSSIGLLVNAARAAPAARARLLLALDRMLDDPMAASAPPGAVGDLLALLDESQDPVERASIVQAIGRVGTSEELAAVGPLFERLAGDPGSAAVRLAATAVLARAGDRTALDTALADALTLSASSREAAALALLRGARPEDHGLRTVAVEELRAEALAVGAGKSPARDEPGRLLARLVTVGSLEERLLALRTLGEAAAAFRGHVVAAAREALPEPALRAVALQTLAGLADARLAPLFARALADADPDVREAAAAGLVGLGGAALPVVLVAARFGARPAREAALEVLRSVESLPAACDDLVENELRALWGSVLRLEVIGGAPLAASPTGRLLTARIDERLQEIARTLLVAVELRAGDARVRQAARRLGDRRGRAHALEALDALLPRAVARRVVPALDDVPLAERASRAREALDSESPDLEEALRAELLGDDGLARVLTVHTLGRAERAALRDAILAAAEASAERLDPQKLLSRVQNEEDPDMPRSVETMLALKTVPIFSGLAPSHLAEVASAVTWETLAAGETLEPTDGLALCVSGRLKIPDREIGPGDVLGLEALFAVTSAAEAALATEKSKVLRILRDDFQRVVEDTPAIGLAICRFLVSRQNSP